MKRFLGISAVFLLVAAVYLAGGLKPIDRGWTDFQFRTTQRDARSGIAVVEIDSRSLQALGIWPWPRGYLC